MIGDIAGHRVRVSNPVPAHEHARGMEGIARHALKVEQGGLPPKQSGSSDLKPPGAAVEARYYVDTGDTVGSNSSQPAESFDYSELEQLD